MKVSVGSTVVSPTIGTLMVWVVVVPVKVSDAAGHGGVVAGATAPVAPVPLAVGVVDRDRASPRAGPRASPRSRALLVPLLPSACRRRRCVSVGPVGTRAIGDDQARRRVRPHPRPATTRLRATGVAVAAQQQRHRVVGVHAAGRPRPARAARSRRRGRTTCWSPTASSDAVQHAWRQQGPLRRPVGVRERSAAGGGFGGGFVG